MNKEFSSPDLSARRSAQMGAKMKMLHIGKPYKEHVGNKTRLCSEITVGEERKIFYYEVDDEWAYALCDERSDAFLVSLLQYAMANGCDISWETPVTDRLIYQLRTIFIPVISAKYNKIFSYIHLNGETTAEDLDKEEWAVGTGASGGVDSFYSLLSHLEIPEKSQKLTHLLYVSVSNHAEKEEDLRSDFECNKTNIKAIAEDLKLKMIALYSNEAEFFFRGIINWGALRFAGMVYSLQNLFSVYYFSSGYSYVDITFGDGTENFDSLHFDLFTLMTASTRSLNFIGTGGEVSRGQKLRYIANNDVVQRRLFVCNYRSDYNCSTCDKCMRTAMQLYGDGLLQKYQQVFDLDKVNNQQKKYIRKMLYRRSEFDGEIVESIEKRYGLPVVLRLQAFFIRPVYILWQKLKESRWVMNLFYKFDIDYRLYGEAMAESIRYSKGIQKRLSDKE